MNNYDWPRIQIMYEMGQTAYQIGKAPDMPSKQAIQERANKGEWVKPENGGNTLPILASALHIDSTRLTDELLNTVLALIAEGSTIELACGVVGISATTWHDWQRQDPTLTAMVQRCRAGKVVSWMSNVDRASVRDWKAATWLLQNSPDTRESFGPKAHDNRVEVTINIDR